MKHAAEATLSPNDKTLGKPRPNLERVVVFDIGSNAIRMVVADLIHNTKKFQVIEKLRAPVRTGKDVFQYGIFTEETFKKTRDAIKDLLRYSKHHHPTQIKALATASFREAKNADALINYLKDKTGLEIEVISGDKEADLISGAIKRAIDVSSAKALLMDIGGGSTELTLLDKGQAMKALSIPIGALKLFQAINTEAYEKLFEQFKNQASNFLPKDFFQGKSNEFFIGTGGNLRRMGKLKKSILGAKGVTQISKRELVEIHHELHHLTTNQITRSYRLKHDRAEVIVPAMELTMAVFNMLPLTKLELPNTGLTDGILLTLV